MSHYVILCYTISLYVTLCHIMLLCSLARWVHFGQTTHRLARSVARGGFSLPHHPIALSHSYDNTFTDIMSLPRKRRITFSGLEASEAIERIRLSGSSLMCSLMIPQSISMYLMLMLSHNYQFPIHLLSKRLSITRKSIT
jgi:hypothetical protein